MSEATEIQKRPQGLGPEIVPLVQQDLIGTDFLIPEQGIKTVYLWLQSSAHYLRLQLPINRIGFPGSSFMVNSVNLVCEDLELRAQLGEYKYGERLRAFNGRDPRVDLYQELLDALNYLRQWQEESK